MPFAVREVMLQFPDTETAERWAATHLPQGLVAGAAIWQMVTVDADAAQVRVLLGFTDLNAARDLAGTLPPALDGAGSLTVRSGLGEIYVAGNEPGQQGPGRVWRVVTDFPPDEPA